MKMLFVPLQIYQTGTEQFNLKPLKGITYLQEHELLSSPLDPKEVVRFIKENPKLDKKQIGEFISNKKYSTVLEEYQKCVILSLNTVYLLKSLIYLCEQSSLFLKTIQYDGGGCIRN